MCQQDTVSSLNTDTFYKAMHDQADQLRALVRSAMQADSGLASAPPRKIVVSGGKGGVGATTIAVNLSISLARQGSRIVLVDADMNRADVAALCQLEPRDTIADVLSARRTVHEALHRGPAGIQVLPSAWSGTCVPDCSPMAQERLLRELDRLGRHADLVVLDVGSGMNQVVRRFWQAADTVLLITTPDKIAIMDAYAAIKVLAADRRDSQVHTLVNRASPKMAVEVHARLDYACQRFLNRCIRSAGHVVEDTAIAQSAMEGRPFVLDAGQREAAQNIEAVAEQLLAISRAPTTNGTEPQPSFTTAAA
jgi:flagellar biosynthesis protein FlhG